MRRFLAVLLMFEGFATGVHAASLVPTLVVYSWITIALIAVRVGIAVLQFASGSMLMQRQALGVRTGQLALLSSAALFTLEVGGRMTPSNWVSSERWPVVFVYWVYALAAMWWLRRRSEKAFTT